MSETQVKKLPPCPICGEQPRAKKATFADGFKAGCFNGCFALFTASFPTEEEALAAWPERVREWIQSRRN